MWYIVIDVIYFHQEWRKRSRRRRRKGKISTRKGRLILSVPTLFNICYYAIVPNETKSQHTCGIDPLGKTLKKHTKYTTSEETWKLVYTMALTTFWSVISRKRLLLRKNQLYPFLKITVSTILVWSNFVINPSWRKSRKTNLFDFWPRINY